MEAAFPINNGSWEQPAWGAGIGSGAALEARVCPWYDRLPVKSLCHIPDRHEDHHCLVPADCGIDAGMLNACCPKINCCGAYRVFGQHLTLDAAESGDLYKSS